MVDEIYNISKKHGLKHIPSALSMSTYIECIFNEKFIEPYKHNFVIGKPFGSQAYYIPWKKLGYLNKNINEYHSILKHTEIDFVNFSGESLGHTLGVAAGISLASKKNTWVNLSDAALQMGSELEGIQFIGQKQIKNILVTIDYNNSQVTGNLNDIIDVKPIIEMFSNYDWDVHIINGHNYNKIKDNLNEIKFNKPTVIFYKTIKGYGIKEMENNPHEWHYKKI
mgnify:CR=1 FL=1